MEARISGMRMLGRYRRAGCGHFRCRMCGPGDTRWAKRSERRGTAREIASGLDDYKDGGLVMPSLTLGTISTAKESGAAPVSSAM